LTTPTIRRTKNGNDPHQRERLARWSHPRPAGHEGFKVGGWVGLIEDGPQLNKIALNEALSGGRPLRGRHANDQSSMRTQVSAVSLRHDRALLPANRRSQMPDVTSPTMIAASNSGLGAERDYEEPEYRMCRQGIGDQGHEDRVCDQPAEGVHAPRDLQLGHKPGQVGGHVGGERCVEFGPRTESRPSAARSAAAAHLV
jgi:hypothetical protein